MAKGKNANLNSGAIDIALNAQVRYFSFNVPLMQHIRCEILIMTAELSNLKEY